MFFGGSPFMNGGNFYQTRNGNVFHTYYSPGFSFRQQHYRQQQEQETNPPSLFQRLLPIIFIVVYIFLSIFLQKYNEPSYRYKLIFDVLCLVLIIHPNTI